MKSFSAFKVIGWGIHGGMLLTVALAIPSSAAGQYNLRNPRLSKTYVHSRFEPTGATPTMQPVPYRAEEGMEMELHQQAGYESPPEGDPELDKRMRAQQALMHNGGSWRPQVAAIPSAFPVRGVERVHATDELPGPVDEMIDDRQTYPPGAVDQPEMYEEGSVEYSYPDEYYEGEQWQEGGGSWEPDPMAQDCGQWDRCHNWCESVFCQGNTSIQLGVVGFKNPINQGRDGSFGFQQAVNFGTFLPFWPESGIGWQLGVRTIQANIAGTSFADEQRNQTFFTSGFFRRRRAGFNTGFVFDMLRDNWYGDINVGQVRAQFSWRYPERHEWGYWFAAGDSVDTSVSPLNPQQVDEWNPKELHAFFYRRRLCMHPCATADLFAGFARGGDGFIGANTFVPVNNNWAIQSSFAYLSPNESNTAGGSQHEVWNVSLSLVWTLGRQCEARFAPMFDVADNGSFIVDRVTR